MSDKIRLPFLIKDLVLNDSFKIATLLSLLLEEFDDQVNIITLRDLIYEQVRNKLSKIAARDQLKKKKMETVIMSTLLNQQIRVNRLRVKHLRSILSLRRTLVR